MTTWDPDLSMRGPRRRPAARWKEEEEADAGKGNWEELERRRKQPAEMEQRAALTRKHTVEGNEGAKGRWRERKGRARQPRGAGREKGDVSNLGFLSVFVDIGMFVFFSI